MRELLEFTAQRATRYLEDLETRPVAPTEAALAALRDFDEPFPEHPSAPLDTVRKLDELASPASVAMAGPRFFGFVTGGTLPAALAANWLATTWDQCAHLHRAAPAAARLEEVALRWLLECLGLPLACGGAFVTGATTANMSAIAAARHRLLSRAGWDVEGDGLFGAPPLNIVVGEELHPTLAKGLGLLGLGRNRVVRVPVDEQGAMRAECLPKLSSTTVVCTQAGNVNSGACDPIAAICEAAHAADAWVHVDGAFGLWAGASARLRHLVAGVDAADSWATDGHKWLNVPYDCGIALVRDHAALRAAMSVSADYLPASEHRDPSDYTPELSRRARGVEVWAALRSLGRSGVADMIERCCEHAQQFARQLRAAGFEVLNEVVLNQVVVSFGDAARNAQIVEAVQRDGTCWCGPTVWRGRPAMRISVSNWRTSAADVESSVAAIVRLAKSFLR